MRNSLRIQLSECGVQSCVSVRNIKEAIDNLTARKFDIIVCDYNLGQGADGQQFLELIRRRNLLPLSSAFLMVTGESGYQQVSTTAEYSPDDYLLKPFTADTMATRLLRILEKKEALKSVYQHMLIKGGDPQKALQACDALLAKGGRYAMDLLRIKGDLLLKCGRNDEAHAFYDNILAQRSVPWAVVGKAFALKSLGQLEEAKVTLESSLQAYPNYLAAYDALTEILEKTDKVAAQAMVERALKVSASTQRHRELGNLALENADFGRAETALRVAVEKDRTGFFKSHDDYAALSRSCIEQGKHKEALTAVNDMGKHFSHTPNLKARQAALECQVQISAGNLEAAEAAYAQAVALQREGELDANTALEVAQSCFAIGQEGEARQIIETIAEDHHENEQVLARARKVFEVAGLKDEGVEFIEATRTRMIRLNNDAVALAKEGKLDQAIVMLVEAAERLHNNAQVLLNAAQAIMMRISQQGMDLRQLADARRYVERAIQANPEHPKLAAAILFYDKVAPPGLPRISKEG
ncbi:MAG: response regulator [Sterolibacterium sp.]|nr:response regulator [Sterolibacterium sp.]